MSGAQWINSSIKKALGKTAQRTPDVAPWLDTVARKYIVRDMGGSEDPIIKAAREGVYAIPLRVGEAPESFLRDLHHQLVAPVVNNVTPTSLQQWVVNSAGKGNPGYINALPDDTSRLGALTNLYLRKWSPLGDVGRRTPMVSEPSVNYFNFLNPEQAPGGLSAITRDIMARNPKGLRSRPDADKARELEALFREYAQSEAGRDELSSARHWAQTPEYPGQGRILRAQTSALRQMYAHDPELPYEGARFVGRMHPSYTPFLPSEELARKQILAADPYLEKFGGDEPFKWLRNTPYPISHIADVLQGDVAAGRLRPEALTRVSMGDATQRAHDFELNAEKMKAEERAARTKALLASDEGRSLKEDLGNGWRWDQIHTPKRASDEACAAGAGWCTRDPGLAERYIRSSEIYLLRDPNGVGRVQVEYDPATRTIKQIKNRAQSGLISEEARPHAQEIINILRPKNIYESEAKNLGLEPGTSWEDYLGPP